MIALWLNIFAILTLQIFSMPYNVPLQGIVGGKRTAVVLDDLVFNNFLCSQNH
jgi:hypothetical protein